jgi:uncharacterized membrane protein YfcA
VFRRVTLALALTLLLLGVGGSFIAGLLGVGGAIVMIPLLLYVPPALGVGQLDVKSVAGITMAQVFFAALSGMVAHRRARAVNAELAWVGGLSMAAGSLVGSLGSTFVSGGGLLLVFALMTTGAAVLMIAHAEAAEIPIPANRVHFSRGRAAVVAGGVGIAAGLVGAGGAFLLVPLLLIVVGVPIRVTIGSSLAITALASTAGLFGKMVTGQVPWAPALLVALGALPGAQLGALVSQRLAEAHLKTALLVVILVTAARVWWDVLSRFIGS